MLETDRKAYRPLDIAESAVLVTQPPSGARLYTRAVARRKRRSLGVLSRILAAGFTGLAIWAGLARQWVILAAIVAIGAWFAESAYKTLR